MESDEDDDGGCVTCFQDDEEPQDDKYAPDGGYIPRVLFLDPKGEVHADVTNRNGNPKYKYFYMDDRQG